MISLYLATTEKGAAQNASADAVNGVKEKVDEATGASRFRSVVLLCQSIPCYQFFKFFRDGYFIAGSLFWCLKFGDERQIYLELWHHIWQFDFVFKYSMVWYSGLAGYVTIAYLTQLPY